MSDEGTNPRYEVLFSVRGHSLDIDRISDIVGREPSEVWRQRHQHIRERYPDLPTEAWHLTLESDTEQDGTPWIEEVLDVLKSRGDELRDYAAEKNLELSLTITIRQGDFHALFSLTPDMMRQLAEMNCSFGAAFYR